MVQVTQMLFMGSVDMQWQQHRTLCLHKNFVMLFGLSVRNMYITSKFTTNCCMCEWSMPDSGTEN